MGAARSDLLSGEEGRNGGEGRVSSDDRSLDRHSGGAAIISSTFGFKVDSRWWKQHILGPGLPRRLSLSPSLAPSLDPRSCSIPPPP